MEYGLLTWNDSPKPGWYDVDGNLVPEEDIAERYHDEVVARSGVRPFDEGMGNDYKDGTDEEEAEVFLDHDVTFSVPTREIAEEYVKLDEAHTSFAADAESGEWNVTRHAGSMIRVPRRAAMTRTVGGQFPKASIRSSGVFRLPWSAMSTRSPCGTSLLRSTPTCPQASRRPKSSRRCIRRWWPPRRAPVSAAWLHAQAVLGSLPQP